MKKKRTWLCLGVVLLSVFLAWKFFLTSSLVTASELDRSLPNLVQANRGVFNDACQRQVKPWFSSKKKYEHTQLIFYGKPVMQAVKHICVEKKWSMTLILNDSVIGAKELQRMSSKQDTFSIIYTSSRLLHQPILQDLANSSNALVSSIRYAFKITGAKKAQLEAFRSFFEKHGCDMKIMPSSFILDKPKECMQFFRHARLDPDAWWVLKPSSGFGGEGITVHTSMTYLYKKFALCQSKEQFVVQKYLSQLLLIEGRKFDVRGLVLIAGTTPYFLFYHEGYLRVSIKKFSANSDKDVHLTNSHIQTQSSNFSADKHFWSFERFQKYLNSYHPKSTDFVSEHLVPFIKKVGLFILQTGIVIIVVHTLCSLNGINLEIYIYFFLLLLQTVGMSVFQRNPSSFQLLGLDFMITDDLHIWFIEANNYPLWPKVSSSSSFVNELMDTLGV